jgi:hypothetical protein
MISCWQHYAMDELQSEAEELKSLATRKPTPARRALAAQALASKWEGSQALAVTALARWGDRESVDAIRQFLEAAFERRNGWAVRGVAIRELARVIGPEHAGWITELCRSRSSGLERHELRPLIECLSTFDE